MIRRAATTAIHSALLDTPVVLIQGPRQAGKSTLAQNLAQSHFKGAYATMDDPLVLGEARSNPSGFLKGRGTPLVIDEVQRAPELFLAIKLIIDRDRKPGQYLLTGSANVLLAPKVADSLAGRMEPIDLFPLSQAEVEGVVDNFVDAVFSGVDPREIALAPGRPLVERIARGGFPEPFQRADEDRRVAWFQSYVRTVLDRDVRDLANVSGLAQMPRLLSLLAARSGATLNISSLSVETGAPHTTLTRYLDLFKALFLIQTIPAWSADVDTRLAKTPKGFLVDTGLMSYLMGAEAQTLAKDPIRWGPTLRTFVATELAKLASSSRTKPWLFHLRTVKHKEVDFVLESRDGRVIGIDVCAEGSVTPSDFEGLRFLAELAGDRFSRGFVLYEGQEIVPIAENLFAVPIAMLWAGR